MVDLYTRASFVCPESGTGDGATGAAGRTASFRTGCVCAGAASKSLAGRGPSAAVVRVEMVGVLTGWAAEILQGIELKFPDRRGRPGARGRNSSRRYYFSASGRAGNVGSGLWMCGVLNVWI
jgi:hypothetical protein